MFNERFQVRSSQSPDQKLTATITVAKRVSDPLENLSEEAEEADNGETDDTNLIEHVEELLEPLEIEISAVPFSTEEPVEERPSHFGERAPVE